MLEHGGFKAWIMCNGRRSVHYAEDIYDDTATCWIPSEVGAKFAVHWRCLDPENASSGHVLVDGKDLASGIIRPGNFGPIHREGAKTSSGKIRPFTFGHLNLTDDDSLADRHDPTLVDLGSIELRLTWVRLGSTTNFTGYDAQNRGLVHERAKKVGSHYTVYGAPVDGSATRAVTTAPLNPDEPGPHVRFIFRYRPLGILQAQGIAPRPKRQRGDEEEDEDEDRAPPVIEISDTEGTPEPITIPSTKPEPVTPNAKRVRLNSSSPTSENFGISGEHEEPSTPSGTEFEDSVSQNGNENGTDPTTSDEHNVQTEIDLPGLQTHTSPAFSETPEPEGPSLGDDLDGNFFETDD